MKIYKSIIIAIFGIMASIHLYAQHNPVIFADVPDISMIRVGDTYYMSSTIMHSGMVDTHGGRWFANFFRYFGSAGKISYMVPIECASIQLKNKMLYFKTEYDA